MKIIAKTGREEIAIVYIAEMANGKKIEFVESVQPPIPREEKWVLIISTLYGCPVKCRFCDAGTHYQGKLSKDEITAQFDYLIQKRFPNRRIPIPKFKIQFARIGEPAFNNSLIDVLDELPFLYEAPGLMVCLSTIAPQGTDNFFKKLKTVKEKYYQGRFQLQFSIHTTDDKLRDWLMPIKRWDLKKISEYGEVFFEPGDRKIGLNFALAKGMPIKPAILLNHFDPEKFLIKITPVNPTYRAAKNKIISQIDPEQKDYEIIDQLKDVGYEVILSIGELEENNIGSNCGQYLAPYLETKRTIKGGYTYPITLLSSPSLAQTEPE